MRFVPYTELGDTPNVVVDGDRTNSTLLTLSHWPGSRVPRSLAADLSAEIALLYLEQPEHHVAADVVSNNHLDEDGLMGVWALVAPDDALARRANVIDVARAGDFGWSVTRDAARVTFALGTLVDPEFSTLDPSLFDAEYPSMAANLYAELLPRVPELLDGIDAFRDLWADEDDHLTRSNEAIERGDGLIEEHPDLDLAIVTLPSMEPHIVHRFLQRRRAGLHPMAVHNRTERSRIAYVRGRHYSIELRYETAVQFVSRPVLPRPDLGLFAERLNETEASGGNWHFDGVGGLTPKLRLMDADESTIDAAAFVGALLAFLATAEPAWDPWAEPGFR